MTTRNYGLRPDNQPAYEPPPERPDWWGRIAIAFSSAVTLAGILAMAWGVAYFLHWIAEAFRFTALP
jgi:hypothetical protein